MFYPDRHHPVFFLVDALIAAGARAAFVRDARTEGCWGFVVNERVVVWLIDNRWAHERVTEDPAAAKLIAAGALVMCAQKPDAERIGAKWLTLAVTPGYRAPAKPVEKLFDVGFVGYVHDAGRMCALTHVSRHFKLSVTQGVFGDSAVSTYWQSKVGLNVPTQYGAADAYDSANMRCFEILASGTPLVTPYEPYLAELGIVEGASCVTYRNLDALMACIQYLIDHPADAQNTGIVGAQLALERHTYAHRAAQVLEWLK